MMILHLAFLVTRQILDISMCLLMIIGHWDALTQANCELRQVVNERTRPGIPTTLWSPHKGSREARYMLLQDPQYCRSTTRLSPEILIDLVTTLETFGLRHTRIESLEKVVIFLDYCAHKKSYRELRRIYQHSFLTFTRIIKDVSRALTLLYLDSVKDKPDLAKVPEEIANNDKFKHFKGCLGALDGTHIPVKFGQHEPPDQWRNRKGFYSQNVLFVCDFDLNFVFVQPGHEGSGNDNHVLRGAVRNGFQVPENHYYLADGGYSKLNRRLLVPYQKTRYHLRETAAAAQRPRNKEELFNLRHASLRNCIERLNGIMKKRWRILDEGPPPNFKIKQQMLFIWALCGLHNFTQSRGQTVADDELVLGAVDTSAAEADVDVDVDVDMTAELQPLIDSQMLLFRDNLAQEMWQDYVQYRASH